MRRRAFITFFGGAAAWPLAGNAQQPVRFRRVGVLTAFAENDPVTRAFVIAFAQMLERSGWIEGKNIRIDYRFAAGKRDCRLLYGARRIAVPRKRQCQAAAGLGLAELNCFGA